MRTTGIREWLLERFVEPIVVLEMRRIRRRRIRLAAVALALGLVTTILGSGPCLNALGARRVLEYAALSYVIMAAALVPSLTSHAVRYERRTGTWDALAATPLRSSQIADQKVVAAITPALAASIGFAALAVVVVCRGGASVLEALALCLLLAMTAFLFGALGICTGGLSGRASAVAACYPAFLYVGSTLSMMVPERIALRAAARTTADLQDAMSTGLIMVSCATLLGLAVRIILVRRNPFAKRRRLWASIISATASVGLLLSLPARASVARLLAATLCFVIPCTTPAGAIRELAANDASAAAGLVPSWMPAHSLVVGTLVLHTMAALCARSMAVRSIGKLRRAAR